MKSIFNALQRHYTASTCLNSFGRKIHIFIKNSILNVLWLQHQLSSKTHFQWNWY